MIMKAISHGTFSRSTIMKSVEQSSSSKHRWVGRIMSCLPALFPLVTPE
jgi:hypothetical protein